MAYLDTLRNENPQLAQAIQLGLMEKHLGIKIPKISGRPEARAEETDAEREKREYLEAHPDINEQYILGRLRKKGLRLSKDDDEDDGGLKAMEKQAERWARMRSLFAGNEGNSGGWMRDLTSITNKGIDAVREDPKLAEAFTGRAAEDKSKVVEGQVVRSRELTPPQRIVEGRPVIRAASEPPTPASVITHSAEVDTVQERVMSETAGQPPQAAVKLNLSTGDWVELMELDWDWMEASVHGDPLVFIQEVYSRSAEGKGRAYDILSDLFYENEPVPIVEALKEQRGNLAGAAGVASMFGRVKEHAAALRMVDYLITSEGGLSWVAMASAGAREV
jgi:hypothetical protein